MIKNYYRLLTYILLTVLLTPVLANAQAPGSFAGSVENGSGEAVPNASIRFDQKQFDVHAGGDGAFIIKSMPVGEYNISITAIGYSLYQARIKIFSGKATVHNAVLKSSIKELDEVVVATKTPIKAVRQTAFNVVALDAKSYYNSTLDLAGLLDKASGVKIRESGGVGSDMNITLNGFTGRNVRVFVDGVPMQGMGSAFQLNNIPVNMAERIEVYKGVVPIEFGADALGGVINIVTNRTRNTTLDVSHSYGSFNTHKSNVSFNHTFKSGVSLQLSAFQNYSDNNYKVKTTYRVFAEQDPNDDWMKNSSWSVDSAWFRRFHDKYRNQTVMANVGIVGKKWADRLLLGLTVGHEKKDIQHGAEMRYVFGQRTAHNRSLLPSFVYEKRDLIVNGLSLRVNGNLNYQKGGTVDTSSYKYSWTRQRESMKGLRGAGASYGEAGFGITEFTNRNESANVNIGYRIAEGHSIGFNNGIANYTRKPDLEEIARSLLPNLPTAADSMSRASFKNTAGLEYRYTFRRKWNTNLFAKHYINSATGPETIGQRTERVKQNANKLGYGIASTYFFKDLQLKVSAEKAYRLPTDQELFGDEILEMANITLRPEESENYNIGITFNKELTKDFTVYLDWSGYFRNTHDFIQTTLDRIGDDLNGISVYRRGNHGHVTRWGTDVEARVYYKDRAMLGTTLTYLNIRDKERFTDIKQNIPNGNYGYRMPNLPYFFWQADASYYAHRFLGPRNTLNLNYTLNFVGEIYRANIAYGSRETKDVIPKQLYSNFSATYILQDGKYNIALEARNIENTLLYDNYSLQKPGRNFSVKLRYYFVQRGNNK